MALRSMSVHGQLHRVVVTACNLEDFLQRAVEVRSGVIAVISELNHSNIFICHAPNRSVDVRDTDNRGPPELHVLVEVYWHVGPVEGSDVWNQFADVVKIRFEQLAATFTPMGAQCIVTVRPVIEERSYMKFDVTAHKFSQLPKPRLLDALYYSTRKERVLLVKPYNTLVEREVHVPLPHAEPTWNHLLQYVGARCIMTTELFAPHLAYERRMKTLLVEEHNELMRFTKEGTQRGLVLPHRGVAVWFCTTEPEGNGSQPMMQSMCDAMQLFASGEVIRTSQLPVRVLGYIEHSNEPVRMAMITRFTHVWRAQEVVKLHQYYKQTRPQTKAHALVVWPMIEPSTGDFSTQVKVVNLEHLLNTSSSVVDLQYDLQQEFLNAPIPSHVKKCFADTIRDDLKYDHYRRYLLRSLTQFDTIHREEDHVCIDPSTRLVEVGCGVLHPNSHIPILIEYATPMILLVAEAKADLVKEHLNRYRSQTKGLRITEDMLTGPMGNSFETLGDEIGMWVAYYEVKAAEAHPRTAPLCALSDAPVPSTQSAYRSTCTKVTTQLIGNITLELRSDETFLDDIYTDRATINKVDNAWKRGLQSLRNMYQTPIKQYIPPPLECDALERSTRVIDVIRSPVVDECLKTLVKEASHLTDRADSIEDLFKLLTNVVSKRRTVDEQTVEAVAANVMQKAMYTDVRHTSAKRKREALTLEQIRRAWTPLKWNSSAPYTLQQVRDASTEETEVESEGGQEDAYTAFRNDLASKYSTFWAVEQDALSHILRTYRCDEGVWSYCSEDEILLTPFKQHAPTLVVYTLEYGNDEHGHRQLYTRLLTD